MKLSLQSKITYQSTHNKRRFMIRKENLHIEDEIEYSRFQKLYEEYGNGLTQKEFAKYFLDIDYASYYRLQAGIRGTSTILTREFYQEEELEEIRKSVLEDTGLKKGDTLNDEKLKELHDLYGNRFSLKMFAEEVFALNDHRVNDLNANKSAEAKVLTRSFIDAKQIRKIRETLVNNETNLHIESKIKLDQFENLYNKYVSPELNISKEDFALKVLKVAQDTFKRFAKGARKDVTIFSSYPINPDYIANLREKVILSENLHIDDPISVERFEELYEKYAGILTKEVFAEEILDTSIDSVKNAKRRKYNINVLSRIEVPETYLEELKEKIKIENDFGYHVKKTLVEIEELYARYGGILSRKQFATLVLEISENSFNFLNEEKINETYIFSKHKKIDFKELRKKVIEENKLHYDDEINYGVFHKLHQKYAPEVREHIFAEKVLDISQSNLNNIRHDKVHKKTHILLEEPLPTNEEIENLKNLIISKYKFHRKDKINYEKFKKIYNKHAGVMPEDYFANKIFDMHPSVLQRIKRVYKLRKSSLKNKKLSINEIKDLEKLGETEILLKTFMKPEELEELIQNARTENGLYPGKEISLEEFEIYYGKYKHILSRNEFAKQVINIERGKLRQLEEKEKETVTITIKEDLDVPEIPNQETINQIRDCLSMRLSKEQIAGALFIPLTAVDNYLKYIRENKIFDIEKTKKKIRKIKKKIPEKKLKELKNKTEKILDKFLEDPKYMSIVEEWMELCMENIEAKDFPEDDIDLLGDAISFTQAGSKNIQYYSHICIHKRQYKKAYKFISDNIENEGITKNEKEDLRKLRQIIRNAMKKEDALYLISAGCESTEEIVRKTGLLEVEVVKMKKRLASSRKPGLSDGPEI